jgi:cob(I)alamin adenosyltransferase
MKDQEAEKNMWYTRKGDKGTTTLYNCDGVRLSKGADVFDVLGSLDELNSYLGICKAKEGLDGKIEDAVHDIQEKLFIIQAEVAGAEKTISEEILKKLEAQIALVKKDLPEIHSFSIPGATETGAMFDYARTLARKAERAVVKALDAGDTEVSEHTLAYLNRLSSALFAFARKINHEQNSPEKAPTYKE